MMFASYAGMNWFKDVVGGFRDIGSMVLVCVFSYNPSFCEVATVKQIHIGLETFRCDDSGFGILSQVNVCISPSILYIPYSISEIVASIITVFIGCFFVNSRNKQTFFLK